KGLADQQQRGRMLREEVDEEDIAHTVAKWTGIPVTRLLEGEVQKLVKMEDRLRARVVGQDDAIRAVANAVRRGRAGLSDPNRPIGSFLFPRPTGVGKTELPRALAEFMFADQRAMIRLDIPEYMEQHTVVIMTSNLGSHIFREYEKPDKVRPLIMQELCNTLRPEFLNRIDEVVIFTPLGHEQIELIVDIQLDHLRRRLAAKRIGLEVT